MCSIENKVNYLLKVPSSLPLISLYLDVFKYLEVLRLLVDISVHGQKTKS